jgi:signal transduction histidine kinase
LFVTVRFLAAGWTWDGVRELARTERARSAVLDVVVAGVLAWTTLPMSKPMFWPPVVVVAVFAALVVRRRWPVLSMVICCLVLLAGANMLPAVVALYTLASRRGAALVAWLAGAAACVLLLVVGHVRWSTDWKYVLLGAGVFVVLPLLAGFWMLQRRTLLEALRGRADQAERERDLLARHAVAAERRRIAGEMHDVVAHRVSVIAVQAGALSVVGDDRAGRIGEVIRQSSTATLSELRDMLRVLRSDETETGPTQGIDAIGTLVAQSRAVGIDVTPRLPDPPPDAPDAIGRAAFRVVQEGLTNVGKHAPGARAQVVVDVSGDDLVVEVVNTAPADAPAALPSSGLGLIGMRERVTLAGGTVVTGPTDEGGYRVRAVFPLRQDSHHR